MTPPTTHRPASNAFLIDFDLSRLPLTNLAQATPRARSFIKKILNQELVDRLQETSGNYKKEMAALLKEADFDYERLKEYTLLHFFTKELVPNAKKLKLPAKKIHELQKQVEHLPPIPIRNLLQLDLPVKDHPVLGKEFRKAQTAAFGEFIGLDRAKIDRLCTRDIDWENVNAAVLQPLMTEKLITEEERIELLEVTELAHLTGDNLKLIMASRAEGARSPVGCIPWDQAKWVEIITKSKAPVPSKEPSVESYAENLRVNIESTFPSRYMLDRLIKSGNGYEAEIGLLETVERLRLENQDGPIVRGEDFDPETLNWDGIPPDDKEQMVQALRRLISFSNTYRHLGLLELINHPRWERQKKSDEIRKWLGALYRFYQSNPHIDLERTDFLAADNAIRWQGIAKRYHEPIKKQMMAYQRIISLTDDHATSLRLLRNGLASSMAIASLGEDQFRQKAGLDHEMGSRIYLRAKDTATVSSHFFEAARDAMQGTFRSLQVSNPHPLVNDLRGIDGFEALFGSHNYCHCDHCQSILGPAAYFTDLMHFVDENVSARRFVPQRQDHPLYLKNRRLDLWDELALTCANTDTEIPYLQVVIEVLRNYIERAEGIADAFESIAQAEFSTALPVNLPLEELRILIEHFDYSLYDVYKLLQAPKAQQLREKLHLSEEELRIIVTPDTAAAPIRFGIAPVADPNMPLGEIDVQDFLNRARISRGDLDDLLKTRFLPDIQGVSVERREDSTDIQKYEEVLAGLTGARLDLIHRYLRLWKKASWTLAEFDLLLRSLAPDESNSTLEHTDAEGNPGILALAHLAIVQEGLHLTAEELSALVFQIPSIPVNGNEKSLVERLFDLENLFGNAPTWADESLPPGPSVTVPADPTEDTITPLIVAGLSIDATELDSLLEFLGYDPTGDIVINIRVISDLYRHARVANALNWPVADFLGGIRLLYDSTPLTGMEQIHGLIEFSEFLKQSPLTIGAFRFICLGEESRGHRFAFNATEARSIVQELQNSDITDKVDLLRAYLQQTFHFSAEQLDQDVLRLVTIDIQGNGITAALDIDVNQPIDPDILDPLVGLLRKLEQVSFLFRELQFSPEGISYLANNNAVFGIGDLSQLGIRDVQSVVFYSQLTVDKAIEGEFQDQLRSYQANGNFSPQLIDLLAGIWEQPADRLQSLAEAFSFPETALAAVRSLKTLADFCAKLGIGGHLAVKLLGTGYDELSAARDVARGAFSSKYSDEPTRSEKLEPFDDKINMVIRDALCDYIIDRNDRFKFSDRADLYNFFLLDVDMDGCFRTSRLVSAISSLQLYIHRCLINLEKSDPDLNPDIEYVAVDPSLIPAQEWQWRKNYRVWEANRKVFLYPENYIDPTRRSDKTNLFRELEEELLQENISLESAQAAYEKYLAQFYDHTRLRYAGAYYHADTGDSPFYKIPTTPRLKTGFEGYILLTDTYHFTLSDKGTYYLFARTNVDPYQYYYRTYDHTAREWGNWESIDIAIEADEVSALVYRGRLYIFWTQVQRKELTQVTGGDAASNGHNFKLYAKYSYLQEDGQWRLPQRVYVGFMHATEETIFERILGSLPDPDDEAEQAERERQRDDVLSRFESAVFRKPYVQRTDDVRAPLTLSYIWSQDISGRQRRYFVVAQTYHTEIANIDIQISTDSVRFLITDNQFPSNPESQQAQVSASILFATATEQAVTAVIVLESPTLARVDISGEISFSIFDNDIFTFPLDFSYSLPVTSPPELSLVYASRFNLSLARNEVVNSSGRDIRLDHRIITAPTVRFLEDEYLTGFAENGDFDHYIENGSTSFTARSKKIFQNRIGDGALLIPGGVGTQDTVPLTTILTDDLLDVFHGPQNLEGFMALQTQAMTDASGTQLDMNGPYGVYYWELFFHIPFLIANHLNADQKFEDAKWWYERIFDPTAEESPADPIPSDRNWRFREFRNLDIESLKRILTDSAAIAAYKQDPFDPHAIAKLRISAYQKAVVMKYVDNLIDWGDFLFAQDIREAIHEAAMLYLLARDILGPRPVEIGRCESHAEDITTYATLEDRIAAGSEFLITLENAYWTAMRNWEGDVLPVTASKFLRGLGQHTGSVARPDRLSRVAALASFTRLSDGLSRPQETDQPPADGAPPVRDGIAGRHVATYDLMLERGGVIRRVATYDQMLEHGDLAERKLAVWRDQDTISTEALVELKPSRAPELEIVKLATLVFCVPHNKMVLDYWDKVDRRLYNIRNCKNISGNRRELALIEPSLDVSLAVRERAAALGLEDVTDAPAALPAYRFEYLVEKAKQFAQTVQGFGNALLGAIEKKDTEELVLLRSVHEQNILRTTEAVRSRQIREAGHQSQALEEARQAAQQRITHFTQLISSGLSGWERTQQLSSHLATASEIRASNQNLLASILYLIPQVGSVLAMTFGGKQWGESTKEIAENLKSLAAIARSISASAQAEASFQRREEEWKFQLELARQEERQIAQQLLAAEIRQQIAERERDILDQSIAHADEIHRLYQEKFSGLGLYTFLAETLKRVFQEVYNVALSTARAAEDAYRFEVGDDDTRYIHGDHWKRDRAGLGAGELLISQLLELERAYMAGNGRRPEITQTFSLNLLNPEQLILLQQTGACRFTIPSFAFELFYPGQYRRLIKSIRLNIPCVTGPYTNIPAKLTLISSQVARDDQDSGLVRQPIGEGTFIHTSSARDDAGMFDFNFRDERYLPFEGAGAVNSTWRLDLPSTVRPFDYDTISDVLLTMSYTALEGDREYREAAEEQLATSLTSAGASSGLFRIISLRHEFGDAFHSLIGVANEAETSRSASIRLDERHFPTFLRGKILTITESRVYLKPKPDSVLSVLPVIRLNGVNVTTDPALDIPAPDAQDSTDINPIKGGSISLSGSDPLGDWEIEIEASQDDMATIEDVLIYFSYRVS